jgi:hypothetical protein
MQYSPFKNALLAEAQKQWSGLKTLIRVESSRQIKDGLMQEIRYYISDEEGLLQFLSQRTLGH